MKKKIKLGSKILVVLAACLSMFGVAHAAESASTEVQITIEGQNIVTPEEKPKAEGPKNIPTQLVQTGDSRNIWSYVLGALGAVALGAVAFWSRKRNKVFLMLMAVTLSAMFFHNTSLAAEGVGTGTATTGQVANVSVTVPTKVSVCFEEDGTTSVSSFAIRNQSLVPITIRKVTATEKNNWTLVESGQDIPVNTKKMAFQMGEKDIKPGENTFDIEVPEGNEKEVALKVERGAWTTSEQTETGLELAFEYTLGQKPFTLSFDLNGGKGSIPPMSVHNGETVTLPAAERDGYALTGWMDPAGKIHTTKYVMPIGDTVLVAQWEKTNAYATYCADDQSLNFYRSLKPIEVGSTYRGKKVTAVYEGFETKRYGVGQAPWHSYRTEILRIEFHDYIAPTSLAYWFYENYYVNYADMRKLNTSQVTNMEYMCAKLGIYADTLEVKGMPNWDVSKVTNMDFAFCWVGKNAQQVILGNLSSWNVSNVTTMCRTFSDVGTYATDLQFGGLEQWNVSKVTNVSNMFRDTGTMDPDWGLNLSAWNVKNVEYHIEFNYGTENKVVPPNWVK